MKKQSKLFMEFQEKVRQESSKHLQLKLYDQEEILSDYQTIKPA
jgi:hypothetical protein